MGRKESNPEDRQKHYLTTMLGSVAIGAMLVATPTAIAQDASDDTGFEFEEIVITGTNIRGATVVGGSVLSIGKAELDNSGLATAADFLRELPSNLAGGVGIADAVQSGQDAGYTGANLAGGQGVNLRGLGALSTLVLVNGRRQATSGQFGDFVDIANIPTAAIERMEVLQDGASAIYGSDAVGGVVNFILKRQLDAPITTARVGTTTEGGGTEYMLSHVHGLNWEGGHAVLGVEYMKRENVLATSRDRYENGSDFSSFGGVNWAEFNYRASTQANIYALNQGGGAGTVLYTVPAGDNGVLTNADLTAVADGIGNTGNVYDMVDLLPEVERFAIFGSFDQSLSDNITLFGDFRYSERTSDYQEGYAAVTSHLLTAGSPYYIADIDAAVSGGAGGGIPFGRILTDRVESTEASVDHYSGQIGLRVDEIIGDWSAEVIASYSRDKQSRYTEELRGPNGTSDPLTCALGSAAADCAGFVQWNPFSDAALTDEQLAQYYGFEDLSFDSKVAQFSFKADGSLFELPAGAIKVAVGVDYREETIDGFLEFNTLSVATDSGPYEETKRDAWSFFAEAFIPVTEMIELSAAGRYETFSGTGDYSTFDPKFGMNIRPVEGLRIHGSWGTSFHAPAMRFENDSPQPLPGGNAAFRLNVGRFGPCDSDLIDFNPFAGTPGAAGELCTFGYIINSGGAGPGVLEPETSETWTLGFDYEPESVPGLRIAASYFNIKVEDRIQRIQSGTLNAILEEWFATDGGGAFADAIEARPSEARVQEFFDNPKFLGTFGPGPQDAASVQMIVHATQLNIAALKEEGFDFSVSYDFAVGEGMAGVFLNGTYLTTYALQDAPGNAYVDALGKYTSFGAPVKLRSKQGVWYEQGAWDARLTMNYVDSYTCEICYVDSATGPVVSTTPVKIDEWITFDLNVGYDLSGLGGIIEGTRLNLQVNNLFNNEAPLFDGGGTQTVTPTAYDPNNHTIVGRTVALTLTKTW